MLVSWRENCDTKLTLVLGNSAIKHTNALEDAEHLIDHLRPQCGFVMCQAAEQHTSVSLW